MRLLNFILFYLILAVCVTANVSCTLMKGSSSKAIITVDGSPVTTEEFLYVYNKNNLNNTPASRVEIRDYLDLFINFKLKVREAEAIGLDQDSAFIQELSGYQKQLASPYLTETKLVDSLARVTYERLKIEINASHLLIRVAADATSEDTLAAYEKIVRLHDTILSGGIDFSQAALEYSEDPSAPQNKGNLGYFSAMQMVYAFEETAYKLPIDSVSQPVRTDFGYHLIKVHDKRPSQGKIRVSHILIRTQEGNSVNDSTLAANRAQEIFAKAKNNEDWELLCRQFSEDIGTKMKGGTLPWFKTGDISNIPSFEKAAFELEEIGEIHQPVKTAYGWHIIRLDQKQDLESFEYLEPKIRSSLSSNSRAALNQQELVKRLKAENHFKEHPEVLEEALSFADEKLNKGTWQADSDWEVQVKKLFSIGKNPFTVAEFYQYLEQKQPLKYQAESAEMMRLAYSDFTREKLIHYEEEHLGDKHYDYKMLTKEYRDGILLFQLMETKVWNQAIQDTVGLTNYFDQHRDQYQWDTRVTANIINTSDEKALGKAQQFIEDGYFGYSKYDFYGSTRSFNNAQVKILNNISKMLLQGHKRRLVLEYDETNSQNQQIYQSISRHLKDQSIDSSVVIVRSSPAGTPEFIVHIVSSSLEDFEGNMNKENPLTIQIESGRFQRGDHPAIDQVEWQQGLYTLELDNRLVLVEVNGVIPAGNQELEEIKGQVISDYQTQLESEWITELRSKYQVDIHEKQLEAIYKQYHL